MKNRIANILIEMGCSPNEVGFYYLVGAVEYAVNNDGTNDVYAVLSNEYCTSYNNVAKSIMRTIAKANRNSYTWKKYMGDIQNITPLKFIYILSKKIKEG